MNCSAFRTKYPTWENDLAKILKVLGKKQQKKDELAKKKKRSEEKAKKKAEKIPKSDPKNEDKSESENEEPKVNEVRDQIRSFFYVLKRNPLTIIRTYFSKKKCGVHKRDMRI